MNARYQLLAPLAEGGLGTLWRARDLHTGAEVAVKRTRGDATTPAAVDDLLQEARLLALFQHPNIVALHDSGVDEDGGFLLMELVKGETLEARARRSALDAAEFDSLVRQTLAGVGAMHAKAVLHLDLKPENLMLQPQPGGSFQVKILDFGLARPLGTMPAQTTDGRKKLLGSVHFMAPEHFENGALDERTDLYSLGCAFYYALTQQPPFAGELAPQVVVAHLYHRSQPLAELRPNLPAQVAQWVEWLISRVPADRPASVKEALSAYEAPASD